MSAAYYTAKPSFPEMVDLYNQVQKLPVLVQSLADCEPQFVIDHATELYENVQRFCNAVKLAVVESE